MSGFCANFSNCPSSSLPPTNRVYLRLENFPSFLQKDSVWCASSLVGDKIRQRHPTILECSFNLFNIGIKNAAVLPEPVRECAIMLKPEIISGIVFL